MDKQTVDIASYIQRLSSPIQTKRHRQLVRILEELGCHYFIQRDKFKDKWIRNIIVPFGKGKHFVVGAHYDSVKGSSGANDNASGVCVLLTLVARYLKTPPQKPINFVFFDLEEGYCAGSQAYIECIGKSSIKAMVNFDICGVGDAILVAPSNNICESAFNSSIRRVVISKKYHSKIIKNLPKGDEMAFELKGIPNVSVCIVPSQDVRALIDMGNAIHKGKQSKVVPAIVETMHNGVRDTVDVVKMESILAVADWGNALINNLTVSKQ
ncbi:MAG: M28 family peptidase [Elusimicrobia bacterium]|nr:M28 family peptidase [Elusimicrobiota bacterium]